MRSLFRALAITLIFITFSSPGITQDAEGKLEGKIGVTDSGPRDPTFYSHDSVPVNEEGLTITEDELEERDCKCVQFEYILGVWACVKRQCSGGTGSTILIPAF